MVPGCGQTPLLLWARYNGGQWEDRAPLGPKAAGPREEQKEAPPGRGAFLLRMSCPQGYPLPAGTARGTYRVRGGEPSPTRKKGGVYDPGGS
ncbi:hypothetical protein CSW37_06175 [Thermus scotoductus]|uniref:Uncharacterized protein n=1 Tax=Thermus scotoductus TaxID=37636 RepID=A0A430SFE6_THESC|nr:hypothetical protein CSW38_03210 [Thermus scotoductus]RTH37432.1 hypothetical protein CSW37_06175 [Thermus scotoductus]